MTTLNFYNAFDDLIECYRKYEPGATIAEARREICVILGYSQTKSIVENMLHAAENEEVDYSVYNKQAEASLLRCVKILSETTAEVERHFRLKVKQLNKTIERLSLENKELKQENK